MENTPRYSVCSHLRVLRSVTALGQVIRTALFGAGSAGGWARVGSVSGGGRCCAPHPRGCGCPGRCRCWERSVGATAPAPGHRVRPRSRAPGRGREEPGSRAAPYRGAGGGCLPGTTEVMPAPGGRLARPVPVLTRFPPGHSAPGPGIPGWAFLRGPHPRAVSPPPAGRGAVSRRRGPARPALRCPPPPPPPADALAGRRGGGAGRGAALPPRAHGGAAPRSVPPLGPCRPGAWGLGGRHRGGPARRGPRGHEAPSAESGGGRRRRPFPCEPPP